MKNHKDLLVWQKSFSLGLKIYSLTREFPKEEQYTLTNQIRRCAVSIPSNISEGHSRKTTKEFIQFLHVAYGSANELETQILFAKELNYLKKKESEEILSELTEIVKMLSSFISSLKKKCI